MSIKWKLLLMVGLPIAAIIIIFAEGLSSFYVVDTNIVDVNKLHMNRATMIDADRDAYQAQVAVMKALEVESAEELSSVKQSSDENLKQAWDRIIEPSKNFTKEMGSPLNAFKNNYNAWETNNKVIFDLSSQTIDANVARDKAEKAAEASFDDMRDIIDKLGEMVNERLKSPLLSPERRLQMEQALSKILNADRDAYQAYVAQLLIIAAKDIQTANKLAESFDENVGQTKDRVTAGANLLGSAGAELKADFIEKFTFWEKQGRKAVELTRSNIGKNLKKIRLLHESDKNFAAMRGNIDTLGEMEMARVEADLEHLDNVIGNTIILYILVSLAFIAISVVITLIVASRISKALKDSANIATALSEGNFNVKLDLQRKDEIGQLSSALSTMVGKLSGIVHAVQDAASTVASSGEELASSSETLSQGATEQSSSVEEVSSAMEQMTASIGQNAESANMTQGIARKTADESRQGGEAVKQTVDSMTRIAEKISIVEEIARQTNLLALNAAIEAARAGEHGKGFAVVAAEVRKLAEKSGQAASEISELSTSSVEVATRAGEMLDSVVPNIEKTAELIQEIAAASAEQNTGAVEINTALQEMDSVVQANAGSAEEIASTAEQLSSQAMQLEHSMSFFKLGETSNERTKQAAPITPPKAIGMGESAGNIALDGEADSDFERF